MFCRYCGSRCNENAKFCSKCGRSFVNGENASLQKDVKQHKKVKINKTLLVIVGMLLVYFVVLSTVLKAICALSKASGKENELADTKQEIEVDLAGIQVGDIVTLGVYEQDSDIENGKEAIEWEVVGEKDGKYLLLSHYVIDYMPFDNGGAWDVLMANQVLADSFCTWETSTVRAYLNSEFYDKAFSDKEKEHICLVTNTTGDWNEINNGRLGADPSVKSYVPGGEDTQDYVFLLSVEEIREYFADDFWYHPNQVYDTYVPRLMASPTPYAVDRGLEPVHSWGYRVGDGFGVLDENGYERHMGNDDADWYWNIAFYGKVHPDHMEFGHFAYWALRSPAGYADVSSFLFMKAQGNIRFAEAGEGLGVRPAMWVECN